MKLYFNIKEPSIETRCADITDWEKIRNIVQEFCPIDLLVNNAGVLTVGPLLEVTKQDLDTYVFIYELCKHIINYKYNKCNEHV